MTKLRRRWLFAIGFGYAMSCSTASASLGPLMQPLRVTVMYTLDTSNVYVQFQNGAMPGCYAAAGGLLLVANSRFKELYAQLLTMVALGGVKAYVFYTQNTPTNNWSDCFLDGLELVP